MAGLNVLPNEILEKIIMDIPGRPFKTELLLLDKVLCYLFMAEQVRNLQLYLRQVTPWITTITSNDVKLPCSNPRYCNFLNKVVKLDIHVPGTLSEEPVAQFIRCCTNLRVFILQRQYKSVRSVRWNTSLIFNSLPYNIVKMYLTRFSIMSEDGGIYSFVNYLKQNKKLETIYFNGIDIDKEGVSLWEEFLKSNSSIRLLGFKICKINNEGVYALAKGLKQNTTLTNLHFTYTDIGNKGFHTLIKVLEQNTALTNLNLKGSFIGAEGAHTLAEALKQNNALTNLDLGSMSEMNMIDYIYDDGIQTICTRYLCLENGIGNRGAHALAEALKQNVALTN